MDRRNEKIIFFGSSEFSVYVLDELKIHGVIPSSIVTTEDKPKGRKMLITPNVVKLWAQENNIEVLDPHSLKNNPDLVSKLQSLSPDLFLVASFGKIIPREIFEIPRHKTLNIHPSLLPKYRGSSPIQSQILNDEKKIGVTIMQIEQRMDAGPIITQKEVKIDGWPVGRVELENKLAIEGTRLFVHILPEWINGLINPILQNEDNATYCHKIQKIDGLVDIENNKLNREEIYKIYLKIKAYEEWPKTFFFHNSKRIVIEEASFDGEKISILKVTPEGKKSMSYSDFLKGVR